MEVLMWQASSTGLALSAKKTQLVDYLCALYSRAHFNQEIR